MSQRRIMSFVESIVNVTIGYGIALGTQMLVLPLFGVHLSVSDNMAIAAIFTVVSIARSYTLRRIFNRLQGARQ